MKSLWNGALLAGLCAVHLACSNDPVPDRLDASAAPAVAVETAIDLGVNDRGNANVSGASAGEFVVLAWSAATAEGAADIHAAVSQDGGRTFADPVRVNSEPGTVRVSGEQPPRIALTSLPETTPAISIIWTAQGTTGTTLMTSRSTDAGRSFEPSRLLTGTDAPGNRGWETLAALPDGRVAATWLDHRQHAADSDAATGHHQHAAANDADGVAMAQRSQLYFATLEGGDPRPLTGGVCYCCKTAMAAGVLGSPDAVGIAWRHVYPGNLRDIAFTLSRDGGRTFGDPVRVSEDEWAIAGCPDDGPAMAVERAGRVHLVWPTAVTDDGQPQKALFHAVTGDGVSFSPRVRLPVEGQGNHPQAAIDADGALLAIWDESGSGSRRIGLAVGRSGADGAMAFTRQDAVTGDTGVYPILVPAGDRMIAAWTTGAPEQSKIRLVRLRGGRAGG